MDVPPLHFHHTKGAPSMSDEVHRPARHAAGPEEALLSLLARLIARRHVARHRAIAPAGGDGGGDPAGRRDATGPAPTNPRAGGGRRMSRTTQVPERGTYTAPRRDARPRGRRGGAEGAAFDARKGRRSAFRLAISRPVPPVHDVQFEAAGTPAERIWTSEPFRVLDPGPGVNRRVVSSSYICRAGRDDGHGSGDTGGGERLPASAAGFLDVLRVPGVGACVIVPRVPRSRRIRRRLAACAMQRRAVVHDQGKA